MKLVLIALALVAVALAAPPKEGYVAQIVRSDLDQSPDGSYSLNVETDDGTKREEVGTLKEAYDEENKPHTVVVVRGSYSYVDDSGALQTVTYTADENGFNAEGPTIPKQQ